MFVPMLLKTYDVRPLQVGDEDPRYPAHDARY